MIERARLCRWLIDDLQECAALYPYEPKREIKTSGALLAARVQWIRISTVWALLEFSQ